MIFCGICGLPTRRSASDDLGQLAVECYRCGEYRITTEAHHFESPLKTEIQIANASGYIRENQRLLCSSKELSILAALPTPLVGEKAMKLLRALGKRFSTPGERIPVSFPHASERLDLFAKEEGPCDDELADALWLQSSGWASSLAETEYMLKVFLTGRGLITKTTASTTVISPEGWDTIDRERRGDVPSETAFVAMAFHGDLTLVYDEGIKPGIRRAGYEPIRVDRVQHNNKIDDQIIADIRRSKFLVADFSKDRGGVYFEAGFAMGLGRPVIWTALESELENVHFDTRQYNFVRWWSGKLDQFSNDLQLRSEATIGKGPLPPEG